MIVKKAILVLAVSLAFGNPCLSAYPDHTFTTDGTIQTGDAYNNVYAYESTVDMTGGLIYNSFYIHDDSTVNVYGGDITHGAAYVYDTSTINVIDNIDSDWGVNLIFGYGTSAINVTGGYIVNDVWTYDYCKLNLSGGYLHEIDACGNSEVNISGGEINWLSASDSSVVNIYGYGFQYIPGGGLEEHDLLSGFFEDGTQFGISYYNAMPGEVTSEHVVQHLITEPASILLLGLGGIAAFRKKHC